MKRYGGITEHNATENQVPYYVSRKSMQ